MLHTHRTVRKGQTICRSRWKNQAREQGRESRECQIGARRAVCVRPRPHQVELPAPFRTPLLQSGISHNTQHTRTVLMMLGSRNAVTSRPAIRCSGKATQSSNSRSPRTALAHTMLHRAASCFKLSKVVHQHRGHRGQRGQPHLQPFSQRLRRPRRLLRIPDGLRHTAPPAVMHVYRLMYSHTTCCHACVQYWLLTPDVQWQPRGKCVFQGGVPAPEPAQSLRPSVPSAP